MQKITRGLPRVTRNLFRKRTARGVVYGSVSSNACQFAHEHGLDAAIVHARMVAERVYPDVRVLEPVLRQEILSDGQYLLVVVEVPEMDAEVFGRRYNAFMDGVWDDLDLPDPDLVTFSVRTRDHA
ncbi:MAG TPA: hypothetical protein VE913_23735 [Longimicrobium sp.]|nr:hypothetical protein [Longimicrobium sp.]